MTAPLDKRAAQALTTRLRESILETGRALVDVRDGGSYRESHATFEKYCRDVWGFLPTGFVELAVAAAEGKSVSAEVLHAFAIAMAAEARG